MMRPSETLWELYRILKRGIHEANMNLLDSQHRDWFIVALLPHLRIYLSQQKIGTQAEALEIAMRLHDSPIQDTSLGVQQIDAEF